MNHTQSQSSDTSEYQSDTISINLSVYQLDRLLGQGTFGQIFEAHNVYTNEHLAIKVEDNNNTPTTLRCENDIMRALQGIKGVPKWRNYGETPSKNYLAMELLGISLDKLHIAYQRSFSLKTVLMLGFQMLTHIEEIHYRNILHRDIKPSNFVIGYGNDVKNVYIVDYGLSAYFRHPVTKEHIPERIQGVVGTFRYSSLNCHKGHEVGRRDDLESLGYLLIYFIKGKLPWQSDVGEQVFRNRGERLLQMNIALSRKMCTPLSELCRDLPLMFRKYIQNCRTLRFSEAPDYSYLKQLFLDTLQDLHYSLDYQYDWVADMLPSPEYPIFVQEQNNSVVIVGYHAQIYV